VGVEVALVEAVRENLPSLGRFPVEDSMTLAEGDAAFLPSNEATPS
jgi:hypothetical protein